MVAMTTTKSTKKPNQTKAQWLRTVNSLLTNIEGWAENEGWLTKRDDKEIQEQELGSYTAQVLTIQSPQGRIIIDPIAKFVVSGDGRIDLYAWPSLNRVRLLRKNRKWIVRTDSGIDWPKPWGRETFLNLANGLLAHS
jgi:hypothetical protein